MFGSLINVYPQTKKFSGKNIYNNPQLLLFSTAEFRGMNTFTPVTYSFL